MKKSYEKPGIFMESFEMVEHIARCDVNHDEDGGFAFKAEFYKGACKASIFEGGVTMFVGEKCIGTDLPDVDEAIVSEMCYNGIFTSYNALFAS